MLKYIAMFISVISVALTAGAVFIMRKRAVTPTGLERTFAFFHLKRNGYIRGQVRLTIGLSLIVLLLVWAILGNTAGALTAAGAAAALIAGFAGISLASFGSEKTAAEAYRCERAKLVRTAAVTAGMNGIVITAIALFMMAFLYRIVAVSTLEHTLSAFVFGALTVTLYSRIGNPAFSKGLDMFGSALASMTAAMMLSGLAVEQAGVNVTFSDNQAAVMPIAIFLCALLAGFVTPVILVKMLNGSPKKDKDPDAIRPTVMAAGERAIYLNGVILSVVSVVFSILLLDEARCSVGPVCGIWAAVLTGRTTAAYTEGGRKRREYQIHQGPTHKIVSGMSSTFLPTLYLLIALYLANRFAGYYGIALTAVGAASLMTVLLITESFERILKEARLGMIIFGTDARPSGLETLQRRGEEDRNIATEGAAVSAAALSAIALYFVFGNLIFVDTIDLLDPVVAIGLLFGAAYPFVFAATCMQKVRTKNYSQFYSIRRQAKSDREMPGVLERYFGAKSRSSISDVILSAFMSLVLPFVIGYLLGAQALGAMLIGMTASGFLLALVLAGTDRDIRRQSESLIMVSVKLCSACALVFAEMFRQSLL